MSLILSRRDLDFLLYEWLDVEALTGKPRFAEHSRETFDAVLDLAQQLAEREYAPHNRRNDIEEPAFDGSVVTVNPEVGRAMRALADSGLLAAGFSAGLHLRHRHNEATQSLHTGQAQLQAGHHEAARATLERGMLLARDLPGSAALQHALETHLQHARRAEAADRLHEVADQVRFRFDTASLKLRPQSVP